MNLQTALSQFIFKDTSQPGLDLNLIELVWHSCKEFIAHRLFHTLSELRELLNQLLNQGGLEIKWQRKIKNKADALIAS